MANVLYMFYVNYVCLLCTCAAFGYVFYIICVTTRSPEQMLCGFFVLVIYNLI